MIKIIKNHTLEDDSGNKFEIKKHIRSGKRVYADHSFAGYWFWIGQYLVKITKAHKYDN